MTVVFGHPTGNPNSHHAALSHFEAGWLETCCFPWLPSAKMLALIERGPGMSDLARRLRRRHFAELDTAPVVKGRLMAVASFALRLQNGGEVQAARWGNSWLMRCLASSANGPRVTAVHSYEDCSLLPFETAARLGHAKIYDMPIGYFEAWRNIRTDIETHYGEWADDSAQKSMLFATPEQKRSEMELADLILAPSNFVRETVLKFHPKKNVSLAPYGVDAGFWRPPLRKNSAERKLRFVFAGSVNSRKGAPMLIEAWRAANLKDAELTLIGSWGLRESLKSEMRGGISWEPPCSSADLRDRFQSADVFVLPSNFEGLALVTLEAMACGLPVIITTATGAAEIVTERSGHVIESGKVDALVASLRWMAQNRDALGEMSSAARARAEEQTWERYRTAVAAATGPYI
jgi:glycosyltransferase involved in cell wall biosynthesis